MGDYMQHWLDMGARLRGTGRPPRIFQVNWFQKNADGAFIWPGFGENSRVLEWIVDRLEGRVAGAHTAIGTTPKTLNVDGLELSAHDIEQLTTIDPELISRDLEDAAVFLEQLGDRLPAEIRSQLEATKERLSANR